MKIIILNDVIEKVVEDLENTINYLVNAHTYIQEGTSNDVYKYQIDITEEPETEEDHDLEHISVLYEKDYYTLEIMNNHQDFTIDIKKNEVESIVIK